MKRISLILSFLIILPTCASASFPKDPWYIVDLANKVCAEYELVDTTEIKFRLVREFDLLAGGPCDRVFGQAPRGFKRSQNWIRDRIKEGNE